MWIKWGGLMMFSGVALGAFGAHALREKLAGYSLDIFKTAVMYHLIHAMGLFVIAWLQTITTDPKINLAGVFLIAGIILFSGSLYLLSVTGVKWLGAITPLGGMAFLAAWAIIFTIKI